MRQQKTSICVSSLFWVQKRIFRFCNIKCLLFSWSWWIVTVLVVLTVGESYNIPLFQLELSIWIRICYPDMHATLQFFWTKTFSYVFTDQFFFYKFVFYTFVFYMFVFYNSKFISSLFIRFTFYTFVFYMVRFLYGSLFIIPNF